jgi:hypothetical protein
MKLNSCSLRKLAACACFALTLALTSTMRAQNLTLEGQTGGFITPTAYVLYTAPGQRFSHPAIGYHFVNTSAVIGLVQTFSVLEGYGNRVEAGYTRSVHTTGNDPTFSRLWAYNGMNIFNGKVVLLQDDPKSDWKPGVAIGGVLRTGDHFVTGYVDNKNYTNGDLYIVASKTRLKAPVPFLANIGWKATNGELFGLGGQSTRFGGRLFGGLGIPLPGPFGTAIVPAAGFTQEPPQVKNLGPVTGIYLIGGQAHIPTTMDYAVRVTQKKNPHFAFDLGVGQVAGQIGTTVLPTGNASNPYVQLPVNLQARHVVGGGLSFRY